MDAPVFPPARAYSEPRLSDADFGLDTVPVADLLRSPTIRAMLNREVPGFDARISHPQLAPHLTDMTLRNLATFGIVPMDALPRLDQLLRATPQSERPKL